jgi:hypothetical protein
MKNKITFFIVFAFVALGIIVFSQNKNAFEIRSEGCGDRTENLVLCINPIKSEYTLNEPVEVRVTLRNDSDQNTRPMNSKNNYSFEVVGPDGKTLDHQVTSHGFLTRNWISGTSREDVEPAEVQSKLIVVSSIFDLSRPGTYSIVAIRKIPKSDDKFEIRSNPVSFTILEK